MARRKMLVTAAVGTAVCVFALPLSAARTEATNGPRSMSASSTRTFAYHANGKLAGWVRREEPRAWWASNTGNSSITRDKKGGYGMTEGFHINWYAWPASRSERNRYVVWENPGRPKRTQDGFVRVSATRWNVLRGGRLTGYTRGPDGVAAALGYYVWGDELLPD